jgi:cytidylate kinase
MIIIINGSRNSGKSTVATLLTKKLSKTAHVEIDLLREFLRTYNLEMTIPINLENAVLITQNLVKKKYNVILNYCLREKDLNYLKRNLKKLKTPTFIITLKPSLKVALSNRGRILSMADKKRINEQYGKGPHHIPEAGLVVDSSNKSPADIVKIIANYIF